MFYKLFNANSTVFLFFFFRSSHREVFCKKVVLKNFAKFTGKHLCQSLFFNKVAGLRQLFLQNTSGGCFCIFKCLFATSYTLHFTLFTSTSTLFRYSFSVFNFVFRRSFLPKKEKKRKKYRKS